MNKETWRRLTELGVTTETELRLDFAFRAPSEGAARSLAAVIDEQTDYSVVIDNASDGLFRKKWSVTGQTQPTKLSLELLDQWVTWMVTAGLQTGRCEFDGWGTEV